MKRSRLWLVLCALAFSLPLPIEAQPKVNVADLILETQQQSMESEKVSIVWWIPLDFWRVNLEADPSVTDQQAKEFLGVLEPYLVVVVVDSKIGPLGGATFTAEQTLRSRLQVIDSRGRSYLPLADEKISADAKNFTQMMRPLLASSMGQLGENMVFFLFPARDDAGKAIADPLGEDDFEIRLGEERYSWRLPLGSLMPPKVCPDDGEVLNGAWSYCPWHGTKLKAQEAPAAPRKQ